MYSIKSHLRKAGQPASGKAAWGGLGRRGERLSQEATSCRPPSSVGLQAGHGLTRVPGPGTAVRPDEGKGAPRQPLGQDPGPVLSKHPLRSPHAGSAPATHT